uniref:Retrovirus-related Gag polyprotein from transposon HMS-Beagle n=1 Tax=Lygus hesperus TaxID=30085 RepID=A0A0A9Z9Q8_LYGHE
MATNQPQQVVQQIIGMSTAQFQTLIDTLRPTRVTQNKPDKTDYSGIPEFTGEPEILAQFIERCQEIIDHFYDSNDPTSYANRVILNNIKAKIKGKAATGIFNAPLETWEEIKTALVVNFDDKRDEEHLILEFGRLRQRQNEDPFEFHSRAFKLFTLLISKMKNKAEYTPSTLKLMEKVALRAFLMGLNEDIGRLLITKGPTDLNDAIKILTNEYQFPNLRKKYLDRPKGSPPTQGQQIQKPSPGKSNNQSSPGKSNNQWSSGKFNKFPFKNQNQASSLKKPPTQTPPSKPHQKPDTPFIPYHLRTKDTMSYQTTLNHELENQEDEEIEDPENLHYYEEEREENNFLGEDENYQDST